MTDEQAVTEVAIPWYRSKIVVGAAVGVIAFALQKLKIQATVTDADVRGVIDLALTIMTAGGGIWAIVHRITQKEAPQITTSKTAAAKLTIQALAANAPDPVTGRTLDKLESPKWMQ